MLNIISEKKFYTKDKKDIISENIGLFLTLKAFTLIKKQTNLLHSPYCSWLT